jgi:serine/threonine protein kinase
MICPACFLETFDNGACSSCGFDENAPQSALLLPPGTPLMNGQYLVGKILGKPGGFGITYLGWDSQLTTFVAIKEYLPREVAGRNFDRLTVSAHTSSDSENFRYGLDQFLLEARTLAQFDHSNVVRVRTYFQENGTAYLVMDYLQGSSLHDHLADIGGRMSEKQALGIILPILDGLKEVHAKGFLHRDIKPQNIYITNNGRPILLDFGTARQAMSGFNRGMTTILTPGYAPWEQYHRHGKQGPWTDIYACAATLYHMVTGIVPAEASERIAQDAFLAPGQIVTGLSTHFNYAIIQALSIDPANRPQNVAEFQNALTGKTGPAMPCFSPPPPPVIQSGQPPYIPPSAYSPHPMGTPPFPSYQPPGPGYYPPPVQSTGTGRKKFIGATAAILLILAGGAFAYNSMNGYQSTSHNNGTYEGNVSWGTPSGKGKLTFANGNVYSGEFSGGLRHGNGAFRTASGDTYDGEWKNDRFDGKGILTLADKTRYEGTFKDGKRNGTGTQIYADGRQYSGSWVDDKKSGSGTLKLKNGTVYTGPFKQNLPEGEGSLSTVRGDKYVGNFVAGLKNGQGTFTFANGNVYKGEFADDMRNGQGTMRWNSGSYYNGAWKNDKRHGKGIQALTSSGAVIAEYIGEYRDDIPYSPNGQYRVVLKKDGRAVVASYRNGSFYW